MPLLKPVRLSKVKSALYAKAKITSKRYRKNNPKVDKPLSMLKYIARLKLYKGRRVQVHKPKDPLTIAKCIQNGRAAAVIAAAARTINRKFIPRVNDCNGVITAEDYAQLQKEEQLGNYDWNRFGAKNRGV